jgi:hypothetical protein
MREKLNPHSYFLLFKYFLDSLDTGTIKMTSACLQIIQCSCMECHDMMLRFMCEVI